MDLKKESKEENVWIIHYINYEDGGYSGIEAVLKTKEAAFEKWRELIFYVKYQEDLPYGDVKREEFDRFVDEAWQLQEFDTKDDTVYTVRQYEHITDDTDDEYKEAMKQTSQGLYLNDDGEWN